MNPKTIKGTQVSSGIVTGRVKIINSEEDRAKLESGDIIVTTLGKLDMNMLTKAGGVISPTGGLTSHLAKKCREFNIPCLVGVEDVSELKDNDEIVLDADKGEIKIKD